MKIFIEKLIDYEPILSKKLIFVNRKGFCRMMSYRFFMEDKPVAEGVK